MTRVWTSVGVSVGGAGHMTGLLALVEETVRLGKSKVECRRNVSGPDSFFFHRCLFMFDVPSQLER